MARPIQDLLGFATFLLCIFSSFRLRCRSSPSVNEVQVSSYAWFHHKNNTHCLLSSSAPAHNRRCAREAAASQPLATRCRSARSAAAQANPDPVAATLLTRHCPHSPKRSVGTQRALHAVVSGLERGLDKKSWQLDESNIPLQAAGHKHVSNCLPVCTAKVLLNLSNTEILFGKVASVFEQRITKKAHLNHTSPL